jgi:hypothetical protein
MLFAGARDAILKIGNDTLSDHGRSPLSISVERIEDRRRMVNGSLRINHVANKYRISCSWEALPTLDSRTVDGFKGAAFIRNLHDTTGGGTFTVVVAARDGAAGAGASFTKTMTFSSFDYEVEKRGTGFDLVNVSIELEEV